MKNLIIIFLFSISFFNPIFSQNEVPNYKNSIASGLPLPSLVIVEYERFLTDYSNKVAWSAGVSTGFWYDAGRFEPEFIRGVDDLFSEPVSFEVTGDFVINPFVRAYLGNPEKAIRPGLMFKPSLVFFTIENSENYFYPAYEVHFMGTYSKNRFFAMISMGFKHFLKYDAITYNGETTYFPDFRFHEEDMQPKRWLPATDIVFGWRF